MAVIDTDNLVNDFIKNLAVIFEDNMGTLGLKEVFEEDVLLVSTTPSLALSCTSVWNNLRTMGKVSVRYEMDLMAEAWYYHSVVSPDITRNLVMRNAYKIMKHIMENASLNGWLTNTRALVRSCSYAPRLRSGGLMASARIIIMAPYQLRINNIA